MCNSITARRRLVASNNNWNESWTDGNEHARGQRLHVDNDVTFMKTRQRSFLFFITAGLYLHISLLYRKETRLRVSVFGTLSSCAGTSINASTKVRLNSRKNSLKNSLLEVQEGPRLVLPIKSWIRNVFDRAYDLCTIHPRTIPFTRSINSLRYRAALRQAHYVNMHEYFTHFE